MRMSFVIVCVAVVAALSVSLAGCSSESTETPAEKSGSSPPPLPPDAGHDDHAGHDPNAHAGHEHPGEGPHGGHLIELGNGEYHAELLHDENTHTVTIHLLDAAGEQPVAISQTEIALQLFQGAQFVKYALKAVQRPGEPAGAASRFEIVDESLCDALCHGDETRGRLQVTINSKPYTGMIEHTSHGDHDHEGHDRGGHEH